jgi:hypothetical protein
VVWRLPANLHGRSVLLLSLQHLLLATETSRVDPRLLLNK